MELKCNIKGKEYDLVQGVTITEEYNETLDSASIIVDQIEKIDDLQPYDDVYIYDGEFKGYSNSTQVKKNYFYRSVASTGRLIFKKDEMYSLFKDTSKIVTQTATISCIDKITHSISKSSLTFSLKNDGFLYIRFIYNYKYHTYRLFEDGDGLYFDYNSIFSSCILSNAYVILNTDAIKLPKFYKHFLIYQYSEERLNPIGNSYKYVIELCSETKKLETIQLPSISITQPLDISKKKSVYDYIKQYLDLYNPQIKMATGDNEWLYEGKYTLDDNDLKSIYGNVYCPDFSLDNPSLRDVFAQLFLVKDRIPYVKDDKIYALDITARTGLFDTKNITSIKGSRSYENHADNLKRTYSNALSGRNTAKRLEYLGFRNSDNTLMTIGNMRLETQFPIYKIDKIYMCYYKKAHIYKDVTTEEGEGDNKVEVVTPTKVRDMVFLCKQDITPLVKLEQERQVLSQDWNNFNNDKPAGSNCIEEMAEYKLCTVGYSIGSNTISGWGTQYTYPKGWWDITATYIENIFKIIDANIPYGIYTYGYIAEKLDAGEYIFVDAKDNPLDNLVTPFTGSVRLKSFFFIIDYEAFYNGTILTSKDVERDDIVINDNSSSSLTLLEKDGLYQKEKANRFGNMAYTIEAIYDSIDDVQELGSVYDDDVIIYHREISIFSKYVKALYYGTKDYVLKNYYTSVYSKHRPFALMSYSESIKRAENKKTYILLSKSKLYYEDRFETQTMPMTFSGFSTDEISSYSYIDDIMSFCNPSPKLTSIDRYEFDKKINYGYIEYSNAKYACDVNTFINGYSLCFNLSMTDNISAGNYIKVASPDINTTILTPTDDDYTGSIQDFYSIVDSLQTGFTQTMGFWVSHISQSDSFDDIVFNYSSGIENSLYKKIFALPKLSTNIQTKGLIGGNYTINKDNKEVIDMTFQIEAYTNDKDVLFSEWLMKLSDLNGVYNKVEETYQVEDVSGSQVSSDIYYGTGINMVTDTISYYVPVIILKLPVSIFNTMKVGQKVNAIHSWSGSMYPGTPQYWFSNVTIGYSLNMQEIVSISSDKIGIKCYAQLTIRHGLLGGSSVEAKTITIYLSRFTSLGDLNVSGDTANYYFTDISVGGIARIVSIRANSNVDIGFFTDHYDYSSYMTNLDDGKMLKDALLISSTTGSKKTYNKNMFIRTSTEEMKKTLVYDEYKEGSLSFTNLKITDIIQEVIENNDSGIFTHDLVNKIRVNLTKFDHNVKSVQFWYKEEIDNSPSILHFVFGVNVTEDDFTNGYVDVYLSSVSKKDTRVFGSNHLEVGKVANYKQDSDKQNYGERQYYVVK